jgi:hypothetical protein
MERDDVKRGRVMPLEEMQGNGPSAHLVDFLRNAPIDVIETILLNTQELTHIEILHLSSYVLLLLSKRSPFRANEIRARLWPRIIARRFGLPDDYYNTRMALEMPNPVIAFMAYTCGRALENTHLAFFKMAYVPNSAWVREPGQKAVLVEFHSLTETSLSLIYEVDGIPLLYTLPHEARFLEALARTTNDTWERGDRDNFFSATFASVEDTRGAATRIAYGLLSNGYRLAGTEEQRRAIWTTKQCIGCNAAEATSVCAGCDQAHYCSRACQAAHWERGHSEECGGK